MLLKLTGLDGEKLLVNTNCIMLVYPEKASPEVPESANIKIVDMNGRFYRFKETIADVERLLNSTTPTRIK